MRPIWHTSHVAWSVCLCWSTDVLCKIRLKRSGCRLERLTLDGPRNHLLDGGQGRMNAFAAATGERSAMRPFVKLLFCSQTHNVNKRCRKQYRCRPVAEVKMHVLVTMTLNDRRSKAGWLTFCYPQSADISFTVCLFVCNFVWLQISPARRKLAASNFARWFRGVLGRESPILGNFAPPEAQIGHPPRSKVQGGKSSRNRAAFGRRISMCGYMAVPEDGRTCWYFLYSPVDAVSCALLDSWVWIFNASYLYSSSVSLWLWYSLVIDCCYWLLLLKLCAPLTSACLASWLTGCCIRRILRRLSYGRAWLFAGRTILCLKSQDEECPQQLVALMTVTPVHSWLFN